MDFLGLQTQIINYIQENYSKSLEDIGLDNVNYIKDKNKHNTINQN